MSNNLKTCPFCGSPPTLPGCPDSGDERNGYNFKLTISCSGCGARVQAYSHQNKQGWCDDTGQALHEVITKWNHRV